MLIFLPPSEGKTPGTGQPVDLDTLSFSQLNEVRWEIGEALIQVSGQEDALDILKVGPKIADEVFANTSLWEQPASPARDIYSGVLYQAAGLHDTDEDGVADRYVRIVSALWGLVKPGDRIPAYRLSMGTELPGVGKLASVWKPQLDQLIGDQIIVDCCSAAYQKAWQPGKRDPRFGNVAQVKAVKGGKVVSHWAKHYRGVLCRRLLEASGELDRVDSLQRLADLADSLLAPEARVSLDQDKKGNFLVVGLSD